MKSFEEWFEVANNQNENGVGYKMVCIDELNDL